MGVLRDIFRRRLRSVLTVGGISVGVLALVVIGAFVERSLGTVENIDSIIYRKVIVVDEKDAGFMGMGGDNPITREALDELREVPGVAGVVESLPLLLDEDAPMTGVPAMVMGASHVDEELEEAFGYAAGEGRYPEPGERGVAVVGSDLVTRLDAELGGIVKLRGRDFKVIGLADRTHVQVNDQCVYIPIEDAQEMYVESLPEAFRVKVEPRDIVVQAIVVAEDGTDADELKSRIEHDVDDVNATGPADLAAQLDQIGVVVRLVILAIGLVALLVGALSVVNTMLVAVMERTREIGVKRALGASRSRIIRDVLQESAAMSVLGGVFGFTLAALMVAVLNRVTVAASQNTSFVITPRLVLGTLLFSALLGLLGGMYPARYAARLDPIDALAHE